MSNRFNADGGLDLKYQQQVFQDIPESGPCSRWLGSPIIFESALFTSVLRLGVASFLNQSNDA